MTISASDLTSVQERDATALLSEPSSMSISQVSSFEDSVASQASPQRPMSNDQLQSSAAGYSTRQITPSTSLSDPSSQERAPDRLREILSADDDDAHGQRRLVPAHTPNERPRSLYTHGLNGEHTHAHKRTADGQVKVADPNVLTSPAGTSRPRGHTKNDSATSQTSQIGELSNHLKARLSYALIKVQNGWQTRSIDKLESMTSQELSPVSPVSDVRRLFDSPRTTLMSAQFDRAGFTQSSERTTATPETVHASPQMQSETSILDYPYSQAHDITSPQLEQSGRTYESFWREHSTSNASRYLHTQNSAEGPSLAPPVDIKPRHVRRSDAPRTQPPTLQSSNQHSFSSTGSTLSAPPATPPQRHATKPRTPSQNAAMEQDAVETLLFMSSPGNSGYHLPAKLPVTSLRSHSSVVDRNPGLSSTTGYSGMSKKPLRPNRPLSDHLDLKRPANGADLDKLLDEMPDDDSTSDEEDLKEL